MTELETGGIDVGAVRADTPGCRNGVFLDSAGSSLPPGPVLETVVDHLRQEAELGGYRAADLRQEALERTYSDLAALVNCTAEEIALLDSSTRAWAQAFYALDFRPGDRILTARVEYASNYLAYLQVAERTGAVIEVIPDSETGEVSVEALEAMMDERVRLVAITHVPSNGGVVNPAEEIGRSHRRPECCSSSTPANRWGRSSSMSSASAWTCWSATGGSGSGVRGAPAFSMSAPRSVNGSIRR